MKNNLVIIGQALLVMFILGCDNQIKATKPNLPEYTLRNALDIEINGKKCKIMKIINNNLSDSAELRSMVYVDCNVIEK